MLSERFYYNLWLDADKARTRLSYSVGFLLGRLRQYESQEQIETTKAEMDKMVGDYMEMWEFDRNEKKANAALTVTAAHRETGFAKDNL